METTSLKHLRVWLWPNQHAGTEAQLAQLLLLYILLILHLSIGQRRSSDSSPQMESQCFPSLFFFRHDICDSHEGPFSFASAAQILSKVSEARLLGLQSDLSTSGWLLAFKECQRGGRLQSVKRGGIPPFCCDVCYFIYFDSMFMWKSSIQLS